MTGLLFVTAKSADYKVINRILLYLRDWQYGTEASWDDYLLITSRDSLNLDETNPAQAKSTSPPVPSMMYDSWAGASIQDVESFMRDKVINADTQSIHKSIYLLVDDKGLQDQTCVLAEQRYDEEAEEETDAFNRVRLPWDEVHSMYCNLEIGNMGWEDWCDEDEGMDEEGWWTYVSPADADGTSGPDLSEANRRERDETIQRFADEGKV